MRFFISGIIQGSQPGRELHDQGYRQQLREYLRAHFPEAEVFDPVENHPNSIDYTPEQARAVFLADVAEAGRADVIVAYLPAASMGTAIEMWHAYQRGIPIFTISPLGENWVVKLLSRRVFASLADFGDFVASGGLAGILGQGAGHEGMRNEGIRE